MSRTSFLYHPSTSEYPFDCQYVDSLYNLTLANERCVEVAIGQMWLGDWPGERSLLEVGNVLGHYSRCNHLVVDLVEQLAWYQQDEQHVENIDLFDFVAPAFIGHYDSGYKRIVSISTVEHVGTDYAHERTSIDAINHLRTLLAPDGQMLITAPTGISSVLDDAIATGMTGADSSVTFGKIGVHEWLQDDTPQIRLYGPESGNRFANLWAAGVWVGEFSAS